jgi:hypothetical protein
VLPVDAQDAIAELDRNPMRWNEEILLDLFPQIVDPSLVEVAFDGRWLHVLEAFR